MIFLRKLLITIQLSNCTKFRRHKLIFNLFRKCEKKRKFPLRNNLIFLFVNLINEFKINK